jgi:agmatinase
MRASGPSRASRPCSARRTGTEAEGLADLDIALLGVPMDLGVTNRAGARLGPRAVRGVERIGPYEHALRMAPLTEARVADIGDVPMRSRFSLAECHADIEAHFTRLRAAGSPHAGRGRRPLDLAAHPARAGRGPAARHGACGRALRHLRPYEGSKFHHGGPFRQAVLDGVLDPERVIQIGIRGGAEYLWEFSTESGMTVLHAEEVAALGIPAVLERARQVAGEGPTYLSFDIDSLDPAFAPGTGTPEAGGLSTREALALLRGLAGLDIVGADVVEVAPQYDPTTVTAQAAAQVAFTALCLMVRAPSFARR